MLCGNALSQITANHVTGSKMESCDHVLKGGERVGDHNLGPKALQSLQLLDQDKALAYEFIRVLT